MNGKENQKMIKLITKAAGQNFIQLKIHFD